MHTLSQGVIPRVMSGVVYLLQQSGHITLKIFNQRLLHVVSQFIAEKKNKPSELNTFLPAGKGFSPKYNAAQMLTLFRFLPLRLAPFVQEGEPCWDLFIQLQEIIDIANAPRLTEHLLLEFSLLYSSFLTSYKEVFPTLPVTPKLHFPIHFPTAVRWNGPLKNYSTLGYERRNRKAETV